jgi:hypothetical protein
MNAVVPLTLVRIELYHCVELPRTVNFTLP